MSQKRMRTQSSAAFEPDNNKRQELDNASLIGQGGRMYDIEEPETKPMTAKDREKFGMTVEATVYCGFEITPSFPSFFRPEVVFSAFPPDDEAAFEKTSKASPSPAPTSKSKYANHVERLYICETCFKYTPSLNAYLAHANERCIHVHAPPGRLIYLSPGLPHHPTRSSVPHAHPKAPPGSVEPKYRETPGYALYEIDGDEHKLFCQNLSLFAKLWVESKSVGFDVGGFMFYVLVRLTTPKRPDYHKLVKAKEREAHHGGVISRTKKEEQSEAGNSDVGLEDMCLDPEDDNGESEELDDPNRIVGFFSKEKNSWDDNNLACILVFPPWQSKGIGQLLIQASYYLGRKEGRFGGPERPLSTSGKTSYEAYWSRVLADSLLKLSSEGKPTIKEVAEHAWIVPEDVIATLERMKWTEGFLEDVGNVDGYGERVVSVNRGRVSQWLEQRGRGETLEEEGWLFRDESSGEEEVSGSEDESESDDDGEESDCRSEEDEDQESNGLDENIGSS